MSITKTVQKSCDKMPIWNDTLAAKKLEFRHESKTITHPAAARQETRAHRSGHLYKMLQYVRRTSTPRRSAVRPAELGGAAGRGPGRHLGARRPQGRLSGRCHRRQGSARPPDEIKFQS